ncbi:hypothetical protein PINS_up000257 [Pythium insidiosum]|nr:hypothetical protein PINS_up000257 [Pythium insidiosum]
MCKNGEQCAFAHVRGKTSPVIKTVEEEEEEAAAAAKKKEKEVEMEAVGKPNKEGNGRAPSPVSDNKETSDAKKAKKKEEGEEGKEDGGQDESRRPHNNRAINAKRLQRRTHKRSRASTLRLANAEVASDASSPTSPAL